MEIEKTAMNAENASEEGRRPFEEFAVTCAGADVVGLAAPVAVVATPPIAVVAAPPVAFVVVPGV